MVGTATNCTLSGNATGILLVGTGTLSFTNCTLTGNDTGINKVAGTTVTIKNTICAGNTTNNVTGAGTLVEQGNNLTSGDPMLGALADNGSATLTTCCPSRAARLLDQGKDSTLTTDQRGHKRPFDYGAITNDPAGDGSDLGAVEVGEQNGSVLTVNSTADTDDGFCTAGDCTLREAINLANVQTGADTIIFAGSVTPTIALNSALPNLSEDVTIAGPGANLLTIEENDTNKSFAIFRVNVGVSAFFSGLTVSKGLIGIYNFGTATITNCTADGNDWGFDNFTDGNPTANPTMTVTGCTVRDHNETGI